MDKEGVEIDSNYIKAYYENFFTSLTYKIVNNKILLKYNDDITEIEIKVYQTSERESLKIKLEGFQYTKSLEAYLVEIFEPVLVQRNFFVDIKMNNCNEDREFRNALLSNLVNMISVSFCFYGIEMEDLVVGVSDVGIVHNIDETRFCAAFEAHSSTNLYFSIDNCELDKLQAKQFYEQLKVLSAVVFNLMSCYIKKEGEKILS